MSTGPGEYRQTTVAVDSFSPNGWGLGKTIIPFCSHGGGRFGQSLTAIAKLAPNATMGEGLSIHYSGGSTLSADVEEWLKLNNIQ